MIKILLYVWQLPQNLLGLLLVCVFRAEMRIDVHTGLPYYYGMGNKWFSGCSLGDYIVLQQHNIGEWTLLHEHGHQIQSRILGWLYLLLVGLPSLCNNLLARVNKSVYKSYYKRYPEKWADQLGGVFR